MSKYQPQQAVEVATCDFKAPGMPRVWTAGVVEAVTLVDAKRNLSDVRVRLATGEVKIERTGPRGGGKTIRPRVGA